MNNLASLLSLDLTEPNYITSKGSIVGSRGNTLTAKLPHASLGDLCYISTHSEEVPAQVVAFNEDVVTLAPLRGFNRIGTGSLVTCTGAPLKVRVVGDLLGKVINAIGEPLLKGVDQPDQSCKNSDAHSLNIYASPPNPLKREIIKRQLITGVSVIDTLCPIGHGQRLGLFASAGVGKSTLLGMLSRNASVDVVVIGLIGERGREVKEFIENNLGEDGLKRAVVVVSTSDELPIMRTLAAFTATSIAEHYRDQGCSVLLLVDSITRTARAIRDVGLSAGEVPVRHGYTSSVYTELPRLLERAGTSDKGSITAIYNVLTDNERELDPLAEEVKSILDGHIVLSRQLAERGVLPAVDITSSISRLLPNLLNDQWQKECRQIVKIAAKIKKDKDIILLGGTPDAELKAALSVEELIYELINQDPNVTRGIEESRIKMKEILKRYNEVLSVAT